MVPGDDHHRSKVRVHSFARESNRDTTSVTDSGTTKEASAGRVAGRAARNARGEDTLTRIYKKGEAHGLKSRRGESANLHDVHERSPAVALL